MTSIEDIKALMARLANAEFGCGEASELQNSAQLIESYEMLLRKAKEARDNLLKAITEYGDSND